MASSTSASSSSSGKSRGGEWLTRSHNGVDFRVLHLEHGSSSCSCEIYEYGAHITSWKLAGQELIFLSDRAIFQKGKAIRGGIPIVFPQFGPGKLPQHGFGRNSFWKTSSITLNSTTGDVSAVFTLQENEETLKVWPYKFVVNLTIVLKNTSLSMQMEVENKDSQPFEFTTLLHTYLRIEDITKVAVNGLKGRTYVDKVDGGKEKQENDEALFIVGETDRVYKDAAQTSLHVTDGGNCALMVKSTKFADVVVWNPWVEKAKSMNDFAPEEYRKMICVEIGTVAKPVTLPAGEKWTGAQGISLVVIDPNVAKQLSSQGGSKNVASL